MYRLDCHLLNLSLRCSYLFNFFLHTRTDPRNEDEQNAQYLPISSSCVSARAGPGVQIRQHRARILSRNHRVKHDSIFGELDCFSTTKSFFWIIVFMVTFICCQLPCLTYGSLGWGYQDDVPKHVFSVV